MSGGWPVAFFGASLRLRLVGGEMVLRGSPRMEVVSPQELVGLADAGFGRGGGVAEWSLLVSISSSVSLSPP